MHPGADNDRIAGNRYGMTEFVVHRSIRSSHFLLLGPDRSAANKDIGRALIRLPSHIVPVSSDNRGIPADSDRDAKEILSQPIGGSQLRLLCPIGAGSNKDIGRALLDIGADRFTPRPNYRGVGIECDGGSEFVDRRAVSGEQMLLQSPGVPDRTKT